MYIKHRTYFHICIYKKKYLGFPNSSLLKDFAYRTTIIHPYNKEPLYLLFKPEDFQDLSPYYKASLFNILSVPEPTTYTLAKDDQDG